ncbi:MAG TPA: hydrogenase maturation nickel metallochaperone HypA [Vicinamibacteria bacterium]|nr:hydrogenase maturation nickel metallochaperone HypA [Vicinamibacteria bacterium]
MHEASLVQALLDRVGELARGQGATAVHRVVVRLGTLAGVEPDLLALAYEALRAGTLCAEAPLDIGRVEARWECPGCGRVFAAGEPLRCAPCARPARLAQGDELMLDRIEMEVA